jgi:hypothetical protein
MEEEKMLLSIGNFSTTLKQIKLFGPTQTALKCKKESLISIKDSIGLHKISKIYLEIIIQ